MNRFRFCCFFLFQINLAKIEKRVRSYNIQELNPPREGKRLLVLDIDYTLFDHRSQAETGKMSMKNDKFPFMMNSFHFLFDQSKSQPVN